jgi:hypothetical protein
VHRLIRRLREVRHRGERGAVALLVAILAGSGVLFAAGALVVDIGAAYAERAQLQNGADGAALAAARQCALDTPSCSGATGADTAAGWFADANANDGTSAVTMVCGHDRNGRLQPCPTPDRELPGCGPAPGDGLNYVEVHTRTRTDTGSRFLPVAFGRAVLGAAYPGMSEQACARASWGPPTPSTDMAALGITVSRSEWLNAVGLDCAESTLPQYGRVRTLTFHDPGTTSGTTCGADNGGGAGADSPGAFGLTEPSATNPCMTQFTTGSGSGTTTYGVVTGRQPKTFGSCLASQLRPAIDSGRVQFLPVYDDRIPIAGGSKGEYALWRISAFVITGYCWGGIAYPASGTASCTSSTDSITGYFSQAVMPGTDVGSGDDAGVYQLKLVN